MKQAVLDWLAGADTGKSSRAIVAVMESNSALAASNGGYAHPYDPADLGRCIRLLDIEPSYRERINEMAKASPQWANLVTHWAELETLYKEELPTGSAPKCYALIHRLIYYRTQTGIIAIKGE